MYRLNISYKIFYITLTEKWLYESDPNAPVHAANLVANGGDTAYGVDFLERKRMNFELIYDHMVALVQIRLHVERRQASIWAKGGLGYWRICVSQGLNELNDYYWWLSAK